jgi:microcystin-dependent protein
MSDQFVAEIRIFAFGFAPRDWALCNGQLMSIPQNTALFSLLGTTYGGNGTSTFGLPNLMGSAALHTGRTQPGPGLSVYDLGQTGGSQTVTLSQNEMPQHTHGLSVTSTNGTTPTPTNNQLARAFSGNFQTNKQGLMYSTGAPNVQLPIQSIGAAGGNLPHNNMMPSLVLNYCIALRGNFPARN